MFSGKRRTLSGNTKPVFAGDKPWSLRQKAIGAGLEKKQDAWPAWQTLSRSDSGSGKIFSSSLSIRWWEDTTAPHFAEIWGISKSHHAQSTRRLSASPQGLWFLQSYGLQSQTPHGLGVQEPGPTHPALGGPCPLNCKIG